MELDINFGIILVAVLILTGCQKKEEIAEEVPFKVEMPEISREIYLPTLIFNNVEASLKEHGIRKSSKMIFAPIKVILQEKTEGLLAQPKMSLEFPRGGGDVELSRYLRKDRGTLKISFHIDDFETGDEQMIYFVSRARKRRLEDGVYGAGCNRVFDVKNYVLGKNKTEGLIVNVTRDRHDSALGGTFVFSYKKEFQTWLTEVSFVDSKRPDLYCDGAKK